MEAPSITITLGADRYRYLWLKAVHKVDLGVHCASTFVGEYDSRIGPKQESPLTLRPDEGQGAPVAWYLCGVVVPWRWERNAHLAFTLAPGESWEGTAGTSTLGVRLEGLAPIEGWGEHSIKAGDPHAGQAKYRTCRNWQFAHHVAAIRPDLVTTGARGFRGMNRPEPGPGLF